MKVLARVPKTPTVLALVKKAPGGASRKLRNSSRLKLIQMGQDEAQQQHETYEASWVSAPVNDAEAAASVSPADDAEAGMSAPPPAAAEDTEAWAGAQTMDAEVGLSALVDDAQAGARSETALRPPPPPTQEGSAEATATASEPGGDLSGGALGSEQPLCGGTPLGDVAIDNATDLVPRLRTAATATATAMLASGAAATATMIRRRARCGRRRWHRRHLASRCPPTAAAHRRGRERWRCATRRWASLLERWGR